MDSKTFGMAVILVAVLFLVSAQLLIKARLGHYGAVPLGAETLAYIGEALRDWKLWVGGLGLGAASVLWYAGLSRLPLSQAYVFAALSYPLIFAASVLVLREPFTWSGLIGNAMIVAGVALAASGRA